MVSHTSPDSLRMPPHAVGDRLPWVTVQHSLMLLCNILARGDWTRDGRARHVWDERRQCPTGAWPGQDHARREGDLLWGGSRWNGAGVHHRYCPSYTIPPLLCSGQTAYSPAARAPGGVIPHVFFLGPSVL
jgi:hypothetical protein